MEKAYNIECVEWLDSCGGTTWEEPFPACEPSRIYSVGWISDESDVSIVVTAHQDINCGNHHCDMIIPKCSIINRTVIASSDPSINQDPEAEEEEIQGKE